MTPENARQLLAGLLRPVGYDEFMNDVFGRRYLFARPPEAPWTDILGTDPAQTLLAGYADYAHTLTCHSGSAKVPSPRARRVDSAAAFGELLAEYHRSGYTVRIPDTTELTPRVSELCRALEVLFHNPASAAVFWSTQGLNAPVHHDEYDLFIIQLAGRKQWYISSDPPTLPNTWKGTGEAAPPLPNYKTVDVEPGDVLYLPRGTAHTVDSTTESIHLSVGFLPVTVRQALIAAVDALSESELSLRAGATGRGDALASGDGVPEVADAVRQALGRLEQRCSADTFIGDALARRRGRLVEDMPRLGKPGQAPPPILPTTRLRHHPLATAQLLATAQVADLRLPGDRVLVHPGAAPALRWITEHPAFTVAEIPGGLPDDVKVALAARLVAGGYLLPADHSA